MNKRDVSRAAASARRATQTAFRAQQAIGSAAAVIAARTEMQALAAGAPTAESQRELGLMVTEKVEAFSEAGFEVAKGAGEIVSRGALWAGQEAAAAGAGWMALAACRSPAELLQTQSRLASAFFNRSLALGLGVNAVAARTGERALHPVHRAVSANHARLKK